MTLAEFLLARVAEDEERIVHEFDCDRFEVYNYATRRGECDCDATARLLAECDAKRRIVGLHRLYDGRAYRETPCCARCTAGGEYPADDAYTDEQNWPCPTLRALALPHADHPDYDPSWRP